MRTKVEMVSCDACHDDDIANPDLDFDADNSVALSDGRVLDICGDCAEAGYRACGQCRIIHNLVAPNCLPTISQIVG